MKLHLTLITILISNICWAKETNFDLLNEIYHDIVKNKCQKIIPIFEKAGEKKLTGLMRDKDYHAYYRKILGSKKTIEMFNLYNKGKLDNEDDDYFRSLDDCLDSAEFLVFLKTYDYLKVKIGILISDYLDAWEYAKDLEKTKVSKNSLDDIKSDCLVLQEELNSNSVMSITDRYKLCHDFFGTPYEELFKKTCSGSYPLTCQYNNQVAAKRKLKTQKKLPKN